VWGREREREIIVRDVVRDIAVLRGTCGRREMRVYVWGGERSL
jgi:hypothetical protein